VLPPCIQSGGSKIFAPWRLAAAAGGLARRPQRGLSALPPTISDTRAPKITLSITRGPMNGGSAI